MMQLNEEEIKIVKEALEELGMHRMDEEEKRTTVDSNGLYADEAKLLKKISSNDVK